MRVTLAYFERFKESFLEWQMKLGLTQYEIIFNFGIKDDNGLVAYIQVHEMGKLAEVWLSNNLSRVQISDGAESHAKHEVIHLLLHRMFWLGESRYLENQDLREEWEALVRRLEKVL